VTTDIETTFECTNEPPHRFAIVERLRNRVGVLLGLKRLDAPYPKRELFITNRELKMGYENVYKACFVCVDQGRKETAIILPKAEIEAGLPKA